MTADDVKAHIIELMTRASGTRAHTKTISDDFDLRLDGAIDSLGFIRLISELEARAGQSIDLADLEPEQLTRVNALATHIANQIRNTDEPRP